VGFAHLRISKITLNFDHLPVKVTTIILFVIHLEKFLTNDSNIFQLRFFDNDVTPESFSAKELAQLIASFYDGVKALIEDRYPTVSPDEVRISLVGIENKSETLTFTTSEQQEVIDAIAYYGQKVHDNEATDLPQETFNSVKQIHGITKRKGCKAELIQKGKRLFVVAGGDEFIEQESVLIKSSIVLYGNLNQIRANKPKAWIELFDGNKVAFDITEDQIIHLRERFNETIGVRGEARWNTISKKVVSFKLKEVLDYASGNARKGFEEIRNVSAGYWETLNTDKDIRNFFKGEA
jgi:hypothetical protein